MKEVSVSDEAAGARHWRKTVMVGNAFSPELPRAQLATPNV